MEPRIRFQGIDSASPCRMAGRYDKKGLESIPGLLKPLQTRALCWNLRTIYGAREPSRKRVVVPAHQAT
jgi:hypothetical protein